MLYRPIGIPSPSSHSIEGFCKTEKFSLRPIQTMCLPPRAVLMTYKGKPYERTSGKDGNGDIQAVVDGSLS